MTNELEAIDSILAELETDKLSEPQKEVVKAKLKNIIDVEDDTALAEELIRTVKDDRSMADKIFQLFYPEISMGKDKSTASKEALTKALELKIAAANNIIELLKLRSKNREAKNQIGVFVGNQISEKKAGFSFSDINEADLED